MVYAMEALDVLRERERQSGNCGSNLAVQTARQAIAGDANIAAVAALLADPARAEMLLALADGRTLPAGELARRARIAPSTASAHLAKLVNSGFVAVETWGRHRYFRLISPEMADAIEALAMVAPSTPVRSLRQSETAAAIRYARTCYQHLAGAVGVALTQALEDQGYLIAQNEGYLLSETGYERFAAFGVQVAGRRTLPQIVPHHIDWSERRRHVAGPLAVALTHQLFARSWIIRAPSSRAARLTDAGREGLRDWFGLAV